MDKIIEINDVRCGSWDIETDVLNLESQPLLENAKKYGKIFCVNTAKGIYFRKFIGSDWIEKATSPDSDLLPIASDDHTYDLALDDGISVLTVLRNIDVAASTGDGKCMIIHHRESGDVLLIDTRGELTLLFNKEVDLYNPLDYKFEQDYRNGVYVLSDGNGIIMELPWLESDKHATYLEEVSPRTDLQFNKKFGSFIRANAHNNTRYLYLTVGSGKFGAMFDYFAERGMSYEIVPNIVADDETLNVRVPLAGDNLKRADVQFLIEKYDYQQNTYSTYNIPLREYMSALNLDYALKSATNMRYFSVSKRYAKMVYQVIDSMKASKNIVDDYGLYKATFGKIIRQFQKGALPEYSNQFAKLRLDYPEDSILYRYPEKWQYVLSRLDYINELLETTYSVLDFEALSQNETYSLYAKAYKIAYDRYKFALSKYESDVLSEIKNSGRKISRWVNETNLFLLVAAQFPDTIYQFRASWLERQSIDVYIPSLKVGIEYQGEQHSRAIDYFGGEKAFSAVKERDEKKKRLCHDNGVKLLHWNYDELVSKQNLEKKLAVVDFL